VWDTGGQAGTAQGHQMPVSLVSTARSSMPGGVAVAWHPASGKSACCCAALDADCMVWTGAAARQRLSRHPAWGRLGGMGSA